MCNCGGRDVTVGQRVTGVRGADRRWIGGICLYFLFHVLWRRLLGGSLGLDEAQILLEGQRLAWGYGPQPPLYPWMQWGLFQIFGDPILAMALLKNGLLALMCVCLYRLLRAGHPPQTAGLATLALLLLPQIAWEAQRALTHSVLVSALAALACLVVWTWIRSGRPGSWLLFGLVAGAGGLAKFNFVFVVPAVLLAALMLPDLRRQISWRGLGTAAAVAAVIVAGPVVWMWRHPQHVLSSSYKLEQAEAGMAWAATALQGAGAVLIAAVSFVALAVVVVGGIYLRWRLPVAERPPVPQQAAELRRFLWYYAAFGLLLVLLTVLVSGSTSVKDRWLQPILFVSGPVLVLWLLERVGPAGRKALAWVCAGLAALVVLALPVHNLYGEPGRPARRSAPVAEIAAELEAGGVGSLPVLTDREWLAGNLLYRRPGWQVAPVLFAGLDPVECRDADLVWMDDGPEAGQALADRLARRCGRAVTLGPVRAVSAPYPWQPEVPFTVYAARLGFAAE